MDMSIEAIKKFEDIINYSQKYRKGRWVFRGEADKDWVTRPKVGRPPVETKNEQRIFEFFVREAPAFSDSLPNNQLELLSIAQHHGLPTRLMDWTENPLVALYFACKSYQNIDGAIYALKTSDVVKDYSLSPFEIKIVARYRPRHVTQRIRTQRGLFTIHPNPTEPIKLSDSGRLKLHKVIIPNSVKDELLWGLTRFGISSSSLFPDLDGLAKHISWAFSNKDPSKFLTVS